MDELLLMAGAALVVCCFVLPIIAFVRSGRIRNLEGRIAEVEADLRRLDRERRGFEIPPPLVAPSVGAAPPVAATPPSLPPPLPPPFPPPEPPPHHVPVSFPTRPPSPNLETVIGQKWLGWVAMVLIFGSIAFFLKYAFENRWIGELGRVTLGVIVGLGFLWSGLDRHRRGWKYLSQVLTGGGITILYLSVYGASGYYHLLDQRSAFVFLAILVIEAHLLASVYNARSIAIMAILGGFLVPILLSTGRDNYVVLFTYIGVLDLGVLALVMARRWNWIGSLAYAGTQLLFWSWHSEHYHPDKRAAALLFQLFVFLLFLAADFAPRLRRQASREEEWIRLAVNPFVFYATSYALLNDDFHEWMGVYALGLAIVYAALARIHLSLGEPDARALLVTLGTALAFVTLAIPVQLESNWIAIAWSLEAVALLWAGIETGTPPLRWLSAAAFGLAGARYLFRDMPWDARALFTPLLNRYFLETVALTACLAGAAYLYRRLPRSRNAPLAGMLAAATLWLGSSVEAYTYFDALAREAAGGRQFAGMTTSQDWNFAAQLALSILWSVYAGVLTAAGFRMRLREARIAGLSLFALTLAKVLLIDISVLRQFYRILAMLALGLVLLGVAWAYQRVMRQEQAK
jgi:uncharacterized membrane protein